MTASEGEARLQRRVGTFTLGIVLVAAGCGMLASLLWPRLEAAWLFKMSPLILVILGVETLIAARGGGRVKYDWLGMLLCFILVGAALAMYAAAWCLANEEYFNVWDCSRYADETCYRMDYTYFDGFDSHALNLEAGAALDGRVDTRDGWLEVEISDGEGNTLWEASPINGDQRFEIPKSGEYTILVHGRRASGSFVFQAARASAAPPDAEAGQPAPAPLP